MASFHFGHCFWLYWTSVIMTVPKAQEAHILGVFKLQAKKDCNNFEIITEVPLVICIMCHFRSYSFFHLPSLCENHRKQILVSFDSRFHCFSCEPNNSPFFFDSDKSFRSCWVSRCGAAFLRLVQDHIAHPHQLWHILRLNFRHHLLQTWKEE